VPDSNSRLPYLFLSEPINRIDPVLVFIFLPLVTFLRPKAMREQAAPLIRITILVDLAGREKVNDPYSFVELQFGFADAMQAAVENATGAVAVGENLEVDFLLAFAVDLCGFFRDDGKDLFDENFAAVGADPCTRLFLF